MHAQSRNVKRNRSARRSTRLILAEALEPRILMANRIWDGGGAADTAWSHAVNWQGDVAPAAGDALFFPATGVTNRTSVNDLTADTSIIGITIDGSSAYTISGSRIALGAGGITVLGNAAHTFTIPVALNNLGSSITVSDLATLSVSGPFTGAGPLNKGGNGRLEITGDSPDFAGAVDVNAGVVRVNSPLALGNTTGQTFVVDFATLIVGAGANGSSEQLFIGGGGSASQGALHAEGTSTWAGAVQITGNATTITVDTGADFTISGTFNGGSSSAVLNKAGTGRLILSGSAVGAIDVNVNVGTLRLAGASPQLGDTVVANGAVLEIIGGRNATAATLSLTGSGTGAGALLNVSGNNSIAGPITLAGSTTIGSTAGTLTLTGTLNTGSASPGRVLTVTGAGGVNIGGASGSGAISGTGSITKTGTGTLTLAGTAASTYSGATNVSAGVLVARKAGALGATSTGTVVSDGASLRLDGNVTTAAEPLTINGQGVGGTNGALSNVSGTNTYAGPITLGSPARIGALAGTLVVSGNIDTTANAHTLTVDTGATVDVTGVISGAGILNKQGVGTLILRGANTYTGETDARNGILQLRSNSALGATSAETVTFGQGTVQTFTSGIQIGGLTIAEPIRINGSGFNAIGALQNGGGSNTWSGTVGIPNPASVGSAAGVLIISGVLSGDQPLSKFGTGGVALSGNNSAYTGKIAVKAGSLNPRSPNALGATGSASETEVSPGATLSLGGTGFSGTGGVAIAGETLRLLGGGTLRASSALNLGASSWGGPIIADGLAARTIDTPSALTISGVISGTAPITKTGTSSLTLSGTNTLTGIITVSAGTLLVNGTAPAGVDVGTAGLAAVLGGTGTVGRVNVKGAGIIDPGVNGPGMLHINGNLTFLSGSALRVQINGIKRGTQFDSLEVTNGGVNLKASPSLDPTFGFTSAVGDQFLLINSTSGTATNGNFSEPTLTINNQTFEVRTNGGTGNDVVLVHTNTTAAFGNRQITSPIDEGDEAVLTGTIVDPDPLDTFFLDVDWGDGSGLQTFTFSPDDPRQVELRHRYRDDPAGPGGGDYQVGLTWHDQNNGSKSDTLVVHVNDVAPAVNAGGDVKAKKNGKLKRNVAFTDPGRDSWTATVNYGDGSGVQPLEAGRNKRLKLRHQYAASGAYQVTVRVTDDDGLSGEGNFTVTVPTPNKKGGGKGAFKSHDATTDDGDSNKKKKRKNSLLD